MLGPNVAPPPLGKRSAGVLLHLTSLPGPHGCGDLGAASRKFAAFLARAGQQWWQMLPVGPTGYGDSPYSGLSAFALNPLFADLAGLSADVGELPAGPVDYPATTRLRERALRAAFAASTPDATFDAFVEREAGWLADWALYAALKRAHDDVEWTRWEEGVRLRRPDALAHARREHREEIRFQSWVQWLLDRQWTAFRRDVNGRGVGLVGDLPIFVAHDSADVWQHRELFDLDSDGMPNAVAGVPPDYFSATGQRWGNPLYRWARMKRDGYAWWCRRFEKALARFDAVRLDHFIGFVRYWRVPADEPTAMNGTWMRGPGRALFDAVARHLGLEALPLVAEDLGAVTPKVRRLRRALGLPGIRIVQFAFGDDPQAPTFLPHAHPRNAVVYTGTHDNDTLVGWWRSTVARSERAGGGGEDDTRTTEQASRERAKVVAYLGRDPDDVHWDLVRLAYASVAATAIVPMQDLLGLASHARMNRPGQASGNWRWRLAEEHADDPTLERRLAELTRTFGREPKGDA